MADISFRSQYVKSASQWLTPKLIITLTIFSNPLTCILNCTMHIFNWINVNSVMMQIYITLMQYNHHISTVITISFSFVIYNNHACKRNVYLPQSNKINSDHFTFQMKNVYIMKCFKWLDIPPFLNFQIPNWRPFLRCIISCDQAALWMVFSVCLSVCPSVHLSVCHTFLTMFPSSYHHEIFRSYHQWPG